MTERRERSSEGRASEAALHYTAGKSWQDIAAIMGGISRQRVYKLLAQAGVSERHHRVTDEAVVAAVATARQAGHVERAAIVAAVERTLPNVGVYRISAHITELCGGRPLQYIPPPGQETTHGWCIRGRHFVPLTELYAFKSGGYRCRSCGNAYQRARYVERRPADRPTREQARAARMGRAQDRAQAHIAEWEESGLSMADYCRRQGIPYPTFQMWKRKYRPAVIAPAHPGVDTTEAR